MESSQWAVAVIVVVGAMLLRFLLSSPGKAVKWPPGPPKLPIIGNLHQLAKGGERMHVTLAEMAERHGRMMTVWLGSWSPTIVVSDCELAWEVLVSKAIDYASRTLPYRSKFISADWQTLATSDLGPHWQFLRKGLQSFALNPLHISAQTHLQESEVWEMVDEVGSSASLNGGLTRPLVQLRRTTMRLISRLCFGSEFYNDKFMEHLDCLIEDTIKLTAHAHASDVFTFLRHIPGFKNTFQRFIDLQRRIEGLFLPFISRLDNPNTYLHFLKSQGLQEQVIIYNIFELFLLSVDSTSTTTAWAIGFLIRNPQLQKKLYDEIKSVGVGEKGRLGVEEVSKMQYIHAIVKETMRMKPIAPLGLPHKATKDCTLMGTKLKEGTSVMVNLYPVMYDPKVWEDPHSFMPERFLANYSKGENNDGARLMAMERGFLAFGAGRRVCPGMDLAKLHVALLLANLVSAYHWCGVDGEAPDMSEEFTFVLRMKTTIAAHIQPRHAAVN